jgi:histidyl-tRNA synthetase
VAAKSIQRVKGTRDFYPEDWAHQKWLAEVCLSLGRAFGYQEYEGPLVEPMDLYLGKTSEEIVNQQTFTLTDRDGKLLVLRPELTPTLARMVAQREGQLVFPVRWQTYGLFFRYERPQRGRGRAFFQWNIDLMGVENHHADGEMVSIACLLLKRLGLTPDKATVRLSDRAALSGLLAERFNVADASLSPLFAAIDRVEKVPPEVFAADVGKLGFSSGQTEDLLGLLADPDPAFSPRLQATLETVASNGVEGFVEVDRRIVRGFDYYTSTVFEAWAKTSLRRALFGGGRYDNLTLQVGGKRQVPGVGFAVGDMALTELLKELDVLPDHRASGPQVLVTAFSPELACASATLAGQLRARGVAAELYLEPGDRLDRQLRYASRKQIPFAAILGPDEVKSDRIVLKDLKARAQVDVDRADLDALASRILDRRIPEGT